MNRNNFSFKQVVHIIIKNHIPTHQETLECTNYVNLSYNITDENERELLLERAFLKNHRDGNVLFQLGSIKMKSPNRFTSLMGHILLEKAYDSSFADTIIPIHSNQGRIIASFIGRYFHHIKKYKTAYKFFNLADSSAISNDDINKVQLATSISAYPESIHDAKRIIKECNSRLDTLLKKDIINISLGNDVYNLCILSAFNLEIYYEADFRSIMNKYYKLTKKLLPDLHYISPHITYNITNNTIPYKVGIASGFFSTNNSVISDFGGVLNRLPRDKFDIIFIYFVEDGLNEEDFVYKNHNNIVIKPRSNPQWLQNARDKISSLNLNLLLYLDSTMAPIVQKIAMSKLAPVQAVSHGHPVTSGIDSAIMDYYVSWGAAELEYDTAKNHYTEKLILLPKETMHQYYDHRSTPTGVSVIDNMPFKHLTRNNFSEYIPDDGNWYICMQKPFKRHPEFDNMIASILAKDPNGRLLLHHTDTWCPMACDENIIIMRNRLTTLNVDMDRVHFIPVQSHHRLMALYMLSDVVLDSYHAGGCTTTRESLEIGSIVVTLPSKYLGSRWSLAYYNIMGVLDVVAKDKDDYINIAVKMGTDIEARNRVKTLILDNVHKLFHKTEAVEAWSNVMETMINSTNN